MAIARALASPAKVLLADEPTGNLDEDIGREVTELLQETAHKLGKCVIVVTHSRSMAETADVVIKNRKRENTRRKYKRKRRGFINECVKTWCLFCS